MAAHRAAHEDAPENSIPAIEKAIELGVDYVELDVRTSKDGILVLMHDSSVDRTSNGKGKVDQLTLAELQALDLGVKGKEKWKGTRVPTFEQALQVCRGKMGIYLDHKSADVPQTLKLVEKFGMLNKIVVYGGPPILKQYKAIHPEVWIMPDHPRTIDEMKALAKDLKPETMDGGLFFWTKYQVRVAHELKVEVWVDALGPIDSLAGYKTALDIGVDGIQTDHPERLLKFLKEQGRR
ncbi:MAG: glycerophosphodiester phosphodiesterase family protein [Planctomycetales bacterium]